MLIAGGRAKGVDLSPLAEAASNLSAVVAIGEAAPELLALFDGIVPATGADSIEAATARAFDLARTPGVRCCSRRPVPAGISSPATPSAAIGSRPRRVRCRRWPRVGEREAARAKRAPAKRAPVKRAPAKRAPRKRATTSKTTKGSSAHLELIRAPDPEATRAAEAKARRTSIIMLLIPTAVLTVLGLIMILSAGSISAVEGYGTSFWYFNRQVFYAVAGLIAMAVAWRLPYTAWQKLCVPMLIAILPLMLIALHPSQGTALYGASRWIDLGPITIQPAEFLKLGLVAFAATVLANKWRKMDDLKHLVMPLAPVVGFFALLVIMQRDLGTTIVICGSVFALMFVAGVRMRYLAWTGFGSLLVVGYLVFGEAYRRTRFVDSFLNPWNDPKGSGFQLIQGLIALGSGGWTGVGLGASRQKWDYLPNAHSDFIFAIIGEELGLLGAFFVLVMFGLLLFAGIRIAVRAPDTFGRFLAAGVTAWIGLQTIMNLGAVTGVLPITGVPLPLVSFGGTALVVTLAGIGVLASVARSRRRAPRRRRTRPAPAARGADGPSERAEHPGGAGQRAGRVKGAR